MGDDFFWNDLWWKKNPTWCVGLLLYGWLVSTRDTNPLHNIKIIFLTGKFFFRYFINIFIWLVENRNSFMMMFFVLRTIIHSSFLPDEKKMNLLKQLILQAFRKNHIFDLINSYQENFIHPGFILPSFTANMGFKTIEKIFRIQVSGGLIFCNRPYFKQMPAPANSVAGNSTA